VIVVFTTPVSTALNGAESCAGLVPARTPADSTPNAPIWVNSLVFMVQLHSEVEVESGASDCRPS
jgi:hypothetical protein